MTQDTSPTDISPAPSSDAAPIRHLLVYVNPSADSFDHAIVERYSAEVGGHGQEVVVRDVWTPAPDVAAELDFLIASDIVVLVYPIWFGMPPAMLKGYVDRVMGAGYSFRDLVGQVGQHAVKGKPLLSFSTSGTSQPWLDSQGQVLSIREVFDVYLWRGFGMQQSEHVMIDNVVPNLSTAYAAEQLDRVRETAARTCAHLVDRRQFG